MRILIYSKWFSDKMGYAENYLPVALGKLGHTVFLLTSTMQIYGTSSDYETVYEKNLGDKIVKEGTFQRDAYVLIRNKHSNFFGLGVLGLREVIKKVKPDVVYCFEIFDKDFLFFSLYKYIYKYILISESRMHLSVYPRRTTIKHLLLRKMYLMISKIVSNSINYVLPISPDVEFVLKYYCSMDSNKFRPYSLAVNTDVFFPIDSFDARSKFRSMHGYVDSDIVCLYTGRFVESKDPIILAKAISYLHEMGHSYYKGFFVGDGSIQYRSQIAQFQGCKIGKFVSQKELNSYYNFFDIGVWPAQESTSQLDAAACGMPLVVSSALKDEFRVNGNGIKFDENNFISLANVLLQMKCKKKRAIMGQIGINKISDRYTWGHNAERIVNYIKS